MENRSKPLSYKILAKVRNEIEVFGFEKTIKSLLSFRDINRKEPRKTIRNALIKIMVSDDNKYQMEIHALFRDWVDSLKPVTDKSRQEDIVIYDTNEITKTFDFNGSNLRTEIIENEMYFVAKDVCYCLNLTQVAQACSKLDYDEHFIKDEGKFKGERMVSEAGVYNLVLRSRTATSAKFRRWLTHEVLPQINKHGAYIDPNISSEQIEELKKEIEIRENRILYLENNPRNDCDRVIPAILKSYRSKNKLDSKWTLDAELKSIISKMETRTTIDKLLTDPALAAEAIEAIER